MAQLFIGRKSLIIDVYGMSTEKQFVNTLEDVIRKWGAMDKLITDSAAVEVSKRELEQGQQEVEGGDRVQVQEDVSWILRERD